MAFPSDLGDGTDHAWGDLELDPAGVFDFHVRVDHCSRKSDTCSSRARGDSSSDLFPYFLAHSKTIDSLGSGHPRHGDIQDIRFGVCAHTGGAWEATETITMYMYNVGIEFMRVSYIAASAFIILALVVIGAVRVLKPLQYQLLED